MSEISREKNDFYWFTLQNRYNELKISKAFQFLEARGFEPVLIKGWAAARYYPEIWQRQFLDIDLCVAPELYAEAKGALKTSEGKTLNIDLHKGLRHLDTVAWEDLFENTVNENIENQNVRVLRAEDHLRVLCVHWLTDGGAYKNRLWDIYYLINNRSNAFDWERCLDTVSEKRRRWLICCIGLAHRYLGLDIENTPISKEAKNLPVWLIETVEKEWRTEIKLRPIYTCLNDRKIFWEQVKKRIPPNPIQATVEMDGEFDDANRLYYQIGSVLRRFMPSVKRVGLKLLGSTKLKNE